MARVVNGALVARAARALVMGGNARGLRGHRRAVDSRIAKRNERDRGQPSDSATQEAETLSLSVPYTQVVNDSVSSGPRRGLFTNAAARLTVAPGAL